MTTELSNEEVRVRCAELMGFRWWKFEDQSCLLLDGHLNWPERNNFGGVLLTERPTWCTTSDETILPDYLTDPAAALQLCDRMHREGWTENHYRSPGAGWKVVFSKLDIYQKLIEHAHEDPSFPRAVAKAFLEAHK